MKIRYATTCYKCGRPVNSDAQVVNPKIVRMFKHRFAEDESKTLLIQYLCKDGDGCQADYVHTWGGYFGGAWSGDIPYAIMGTMVLFSAHSILHDVLSNVMPLMPLYFDAACVALFTLTTFGALFITGIPFYISSLVFLADGYILWLIR